MVETRGGGRRFALLFLVAAFVILIAGRWLAPVNNAATTAAAPFTSLIYGTASTVGDTISNIFNASRLARENAILTRENAKYVREIVVLEAKTHDYGLLARMVRFVNSNPHMDLLPSRVIWQDVTGLGQYVVIDKGKVDGIKEGMTVLDQNGYFVGKVSAVHTNNSTVLLVTSPSLSVDAYDLRSQATGLLEGRYNASPWFHYVLTGDSIKVNDLVVTSGQLNLYPRNILLGQVRSVYRRKYEVFQSADITPAADLRHLEIVQVVRNWNPADAAQPPTTP